MGNLPPISQPVLNQRFLNAVRNRDPEAVRKAVDEGADVNAPMGKDRSNALFYAVNQKLYDVVDVLLQCGIETRTSGFSGEPPLMRAVVNHDEPMVRLLLEHGSDPNWPEGGSPTYSSDAPGLHPIHRACIDGEAGIVALFIRYGADLDKCARNGGSPLWYAGANNRSDVACLLVNAGADPEGRFESTTKVHNHPLSGLPPAPADATYTSHRNCLFSPAVANRAEILALLLDAGAGLHSKNDKGETALEHARATNGDTRKSEAVLERYAQYPLFEAERLPHMRKADFFAPNAHGYCLLDSPSTWQNFSAIARHLEQKGEGFTAEEMEKPFAQGHTMLQRGVECFATREVFGQYQKLAGQLPLKNLLNHRREASPLLNALCERHQIGRLFTREVWQGNNRDDLVGVYNALPQEWKASIGNYHQLLASIPHSQKAHGR